MSDVHCSPVNKHFEVGPQKFLQLIGSFIGKLTLCPRPIKKKMMLDLATALSFLHSRGIVHLDIKPANIMAGVILSEKGNAATTYLIDYGMSCLLGDTCENISNPVGTILYMSPEMAKKVNNTNLTQIDAKSDVFSIGLVYLYILTNIST